MVTNDFWETISKELKKFNTDELDKLDMLLWSEINSRDPDYFNFDDQKGDYE